MANTLQYFDLLVHVGKGFDIKYISFTHSFQGFLDLPRGCGPCGYM